jgi:hypothetical protein
MQTEIILIILGVGFFLFSVSVIRMRKFGLERKRSTPRQHKNDKSSSDIVNETDNWPARLRMVETPKASMFEAILEKTWAREGVTFSPLEKIDLSSQAFQNTIRLKEAFPQNIYENRTKFSKTVRIFNLARTQTLGRDEDCEIVLSEANVSRRHALITFEKENYVIYDISSTSAVYVNGNRIASQQGGILKPDDLIIIGLTVLIFESDH